MFLGKASTCSGTHVNESQWTESTYSVWIMTVTNHRSQLLKRKRKRKQLGQSWFSMKSDLLLCIYYYIYNIYIIYIIILVPVFFHFKLTVSVSVSTLFPVPLAENWKNPLRSISKQVTVICDLWLNLSFSLTVKLLKTNPKLTVTTVTVTHKSGVIDSDAFYPPLQYLPSLVLKASMTDTKGCYTPMGDTGIHLKRY